MLYHPNNPPQVRQFDRQRLNPERDWKFFALTCGGFSTVLRLSPVSSGFLSLRMPNTRSVQAITGVKTQCRSTTSHRQSGRGCWVQQGETQKNNPARSTSSCCMCVLVSGRVVGGCASRNVSTTVNQWAMVEPAACVGAVGCDFGATNQPHSQRGPSHIVRKGQLQGSRGRAPLVKQTCIEMDYISGHGHDAGRDNFDKEQSAKPCVGEGCLYKNKLTFCVLRHTLDVSECCRHDCASLKQSYLQECANG